MTGGWSQEELRRIATADDLHIAPLRDDGVTYGTPTWIWSVMVGDGLYVRAYNGQKSRWYQAAKRQKAGRVTVAGITREVAFELVDRAISDEIGARARSATVRIAPRELAASAQRRTGS